MQYTYLNKVNNGLPWSLFETKLQPIKRRFIYTCSEKHKWSCLTRCKSWTCNNWRCPQNTWSLPRTCVIGNMTKGFFCAQLHVCVGDCFLICTLWSHFRTVIPCLQMRWTFVALCIYLYPLVTLRCMNVPAYGVESIASQETLDGMEVSFLAP